MKRQMIGVTAALGAALAAGLFLGAPAQADPPSGDATTVATHMPGPAPEPSRSGPDESYRPPMATLTVQGVDGAGVDRDGTNGSIDPDGTDGTITGPLMTADPQVYATPAPRAAHELPMPV